MNTNQNNASTPPEQPQESTGPTAPESPPATASDFGPVIYAYTRKQALADGFQVDVSSPAKEAGFRIPVFMTSTVFDTCVKVPEGVRCQDERGRLWDILNMLRWAIKKSRPGQDRLSFQLYVRNDNRRPKLVTLQSVCSALDIDDPAPSITIMMSRRGLTAQPESYGRCAEIIDFRRAPPFSRANHASHALILSPARTRDLCPALLAPAASLPSVAQPISLCGP